MGLSADFLRIPAVEMTFTLLTHLENKTEQQLSKFWEENFRWSNFLEQKLPQSGVLVKRPKLCEERL